MITQVAYSNFDMATISTWQQLTRGLLKQVVAKRPEDGALSHRSLTPISSRNGLENADKDKEKQLRVAVQRKWGCFQELELARSC